MISSAPRRAASGFTLLELLVVIGLIAGLSALVLRGFSRTADAEIRQAESSIGAQLTLARASAIRLGKPVRFVVNLDSTDLDQRLAVIGLIAQDATSGAWTLLGEPTRLSPRVRVVPDSSVPAASGLTWPSNVVSFWSATAALSVNGLPPGNYGYLEFTASGGIAVNRKVAFSTINRSTTAIEFNSSDQVRCFMVRGSGIATLLKEAASLP